MRALSLLVALSTIAFAARAHADAISGPPACPPGANGDSAHEGEWCVPWPCASDADCNREGPGIHARPPREPRQCRPWRVCTVTSDVVPGGLRPGPVPAQPRELVIGTCDPAQRCRGDEEPPPSMVGTVRAGAPRCVDAQYCVPTALPDLPPRPAPPSDPGTPRGSTSPGGAQGAPTPVTAPARTGVNGCGCEVISPAAPATLFVSVAVLGLALARRRRR